MSTKKPTYLGMVKEAIEAIGKPAKGASRPAIKKYLQAQYGLLTDSQAVKNRIASAIKKGCEINELHTPDGLSGRVKLTKTNSKAKPSAAGKAKSGKKKVVDDELAGSSDSEAEDEAVDVKRGAISSVGAASDEEEEIDMTSELDEEDQKPAPKKAKAKATANGKAKVDETAAAGSGGGKPKTSSKKAAPKAVKTSGKAKSSAATSSSKKASTAAAPKKTTTTTTKTKKAA